MRERAEAKFKKDVIDRVEYEREALEMAISTWPKGITPVVHYSESRSTEQLDESIRPQAHSDYVYDYIDNYGHDIDYKHSSYKTLISTSVPGLRISH